jgi:hypothetical protein
MSKRNRSNEPKKPGRKPNNFTVELKVEYIPVPPEREADWRAGIDLLLDLLHEERDLYEREQEERRSELNINKNRPQL